MTRFGEMKAIELHNHEVVNETITRFQPDVIHVFSLQGLSKSLIFTLRNCRLPTVYDVADHWISSGIREDSWLRWWNAPSLGIMEQSSRVALEMAGERGRLDAVAPTRMAKGYDRLPGLFGNAKQLSAVEPNSLPSFRFDRIFFCSQALKQLTEEAGFCVHHADIIYPGIQTQDFVGEIKPMSAPVIKFLMICPLHEESGVMTAFQALKKLRDARVNASLSIFGKGDTRHVADLRSFVVTNQLPVEFLTVSNAQKDLPAVYRRHDAFLHTAEWPEPFPVAPLEAMASGIPVVGATSGGATELLRHGENALTYPPGDANELAARVQELQMQPALRCQMCEAAQSEVLSRHNESVVTDQIENYLNVSQEVWAHTAT